MFALRPPEYFPGLPFLALMQQCERFVLADTFQYSRQTFQNRAKLRNPNGWQWITVPLKGGQRGRPIAEMEIDNTVPWRGKHFRALSFNYRSAPYFEYYEDRLLDFFERDWKRLGSLTAASVALVAHFLSLRTPELLSSVDEDFLGSESDELLLDSDPEKLKGVRLEFREPYYEQNFDGFEPGMSALDLLFNHGPNAKSILIDAAVRPLVKRNNGSES